MGYEVKWLDLQDIVLCKTGWTQINKYYVSYEKAGRKIVLNAEEELVEAGKGGVKGY